MTEQEKRDKAIKGLQIAVEHFNRCNAIFPPQEAFFTDLEEAANDAIDLLKAQEPVEPLRINHDTKWEKYNELLCGDCGGSFYRLKVNFCPWCGKQVKWE